MGFCVEAVGAKTGLSLEYRRESVCLRAAKPDGMLFAYEQPRGGYSYEVSKEWLADLLAFFDNLENREAAGLDVPPPISAD